MAEVNQSSSREDMRKKGIVSFRLKPEDYANIQEYVVPAFYKNKNIGQETVGALAKHLLIANSNKYMKYLEQAWKKTETGKNVL
jgi:hypothetical protein